MKMGEISTISILAELKLKVFTFNINGQGLDWTLTMLSFPR